MSAGRWDHVQVTQKWGSKGASLQIKARWVLDFSSASCKINAWSCSESRSCAYLHLAGIKFMCCSMMGITAWRDGVGRFASKVLLIRTKVVVWTPVPVLCVWLPNSPLLVALHPSLPHSLGPGRCCCHPSTSSVSQPGRGKHPYLCAECLAKCWQ